MNERDYVRHNRNATHLFKPSKQSLASLERRWRLHTQNNKSLHSEIAVTPHKEYRRDLNSSTTRLTFSCSCWKKQVDTTRIYGYKGYKMVVPLNSISPSILQHWLFCWNVLHIWYKGWLIASPGWVLWRKCFLQISSLCRKKHRRLGVLVATKSVLDSVINTKSETFLTFSCTLKGKYRKLLTFPLPPGDHLYTRFFARKKDGVFPVT